MIVARRVPILSARGGSLWPVTPATSGAPLLLLDGASLWFRAFYAIPDKLTAADGRSVNALRGFVDMVASLITKHSPGRLVVCLDLDWRPRYRVDLVPTYKAHRLDTAADAPDGAEEVPDRLTPQVEMILEVLAAAGIATGGAEGLEADDVLGTLATRERADPVIVVSGDRDLLQLVRDEPAPPVRVLYAGRGLAKAELFGPAEVAAKYGVPVANAGRGYADLATLRGDASDGLPGVAGIGEKSASTLISRFGSLEALVAAVEDPAADLAAGVRAKLRAAQDYLKAAAPVVRVVCDAEVAMSKPDTLPHTPADPDRLGELAVAYNAESPVTRLIAALASTAR